MKRVLVTGATGFIGRTLCDVLARSGYCVRAALRSEGQVGAGVAEAVVVGDLSAPTDWTAALRNVEFVFHAAARVHVLYDSRSNSDRYIETNAVGTQRLAHASAEAGVRRVVYLSSIKVNGEETNQPYTSVDRPAPQDTYGISKRLAEQYLLELAATTGMEVAIVRPPLVYGPGVRANFLRLLQWIDKERPLPLGSVRNSRSLVSLWNLCDLLVNVLQNPVAVGRVWMVSDGEDISTPELIRRLGRAMNRRVRLVGIPCRVLQLCGSLTGSRAEVRRLCGSLTVDITQTRRDLGWSPPVSLNEALERTVSWYLSEGRQRGP